MYIALILFGVATFASLFYVKLAKKIGFFDRPDGDRKLQKTSVPVGGGIVVVALYVGATLCSFLFLPLSNALLALQSIAFLSLCFALIGLQDDRNDFPGIVKLTLQIVPAALASVALFPTFSDAVLTFFDPLIGLRLVYTGAFGFFLTFLWIILCVNSYNLLDGADGFAVVYAILILITLNGVVTQWEEPSAELLYSIRALIVILCGFLWTNFPPAKVYLGDVGSLSIGFILSVLALKVFSHDRFIRPLPVLCLFIVPILDVTFAIIRRRALGKNIFTADYQHVHHRILLKLGSPRLLLAALAVLQLPAGMAVVVAYRYCCDSLALLVALLYVVTLPAINIFGRRELAFICELLVIAFARSRYDRRGLFYYTDSYYSSFAPFPNDALRKDWESFLNRAQNLGCVSLEFKANVCELGLQCRGKWKRRRSLTRLTTDETTRALEVESNEPTYARVTARFDARRSSECSELCREELARFQAFFTSQIEAVDKKERAL